ncbi:hypothetical protein ACJJTC_017195 [Scirpophaga incertulas]
MSCVKYHWIAIALNCVLVVNTSGIEGCGNKLHRSKRQLLFPNSTVFQFNAGVGTPSPLDKTFVNWAFQANFQLPWKRSQIPLDVLATDSAYLGASRRLRDLEEDEYQNDARLYHLYKYIEDVLTGFGYNGTVCTLRTLCQLGREPLESGDDEDLLHELAGFVLNPRNDAEHTLYSKEIKPYVEAFEHGENYHNCTSLYQNCDISLLEMFSKPHIISTL